MWVVFVCVCFIEIANSLVIAATDSGWFIFLGKAHLFVYAPIKE